MEQQKLVNAAIPGINWQVGFNKCERLTEFKAFWKSIWSTPSYNWALTMLSYLFFDEWMVASAPLLSPTPNYRLSNSSLASDFTSIAWLLLWGVATLRQLVPGATRTFLDRAVREAQQSALERAESNYFCVKNTPIIIIEHTQLDGSLFLSNVIQQLETFTHFKFNNGRKLKNES